MLNAGPLRHLTSDCEIRNCRAIVDGLTPALKAARTAFCWPEVSRELSSGWRVFGAFPRLGRSPAALRFGRDRRKQRTKLGIVQVLQRSDQVLWQEMARVRSRIVPVEVPG